ncbi:Poly-beta-1,6-N-acetyl-D-glucosamine synthase [Pirellulimonas nuda]|uniref:Poly-beta-1,6-N-acetyl-D-glucosamine synthase n=1 Tax=Pirellulimonas nuda TaxID=2528009 RepID=A0A518DCZ3_9BACT|nr:glycosyltransferase family A protein [Pirellulimonas nuda]QDU89351.1 Poly-beta-1,6-N-acetyl-D-glucosamine synthase [Pirellulimonas nuda]
MPDSRRYLLITPCRDEADYIRRTLASVASQTTLPAKWVIVDDGSTDATPQILTEAAAAYSFIQVIRFEPGRPRSVGPGVIQAFNEGLAAVNLDQYDYVCKLDADLEFGPRYFERLMEVFEADPWLGTCSGKTYLNDKHGEREEHIGDENSHGCAKFYRTECFREIGGFVPYLGWDGIDGHKCRLQGWKATSLYDPELKILHLRRMGSSHLGFWHGRKRWGRYKHFIGSSWYYVLAASVFRMREIPYVVSGLGIMVGYLQAVLSGAERYEDVACREEIRRFERDCLLRRKSRTLADYHTRIEQAHPERLAMHQRRRRPLERPALADA